MKIRSPHFLFLITSLILGVSLQSCAPVFSDLQSARTVGHNRAEITGSYSSVNYAEDGESDDIQNHTGFQVAYGVSEKTDLRFRYERIWFKEGEFDDGVSIWGLGPKFSISPKKVAFYIPIGNAFGEDNNDNWQLQPTFLFTLPLANDNIDLTLAPKYILTFCDECSDALAFNLGASFGQLDRWALRLEYGLMYSTQEFGEGHYSHLSFGASYTIGKRKNSLSND
jgi:hypothetical protein